VTNFGGKIRLIGIATIAAGTALVAAQAAPALAAPTRTSASPPTAANSAALQAATQVLPRDGVVSGTVDGPASVPLAGACVTATGPAGTRAAHTNSAGKYLLTGVFAGTYTLTYTDCASPDSYLPRRYPTAVVITGSQPLVLAPVSLLAASPAVGIATENAYTRSHPALAAAAASHPVISGTVRSAAGKPLADICVQASFTGATLPSEGSGTFGAEWYSRTGTGGRYSVPNFVGGTGARISVLFTDGCGNRGNYAPQYWRDAPIRHDSTVLHQVSATTTFSGIDGRLTRGGAVSGIVRGGSATGPGLSGVCVYASGRDDQSGIDLTAVTGAGGRYTLDGLGTGPYQVWFATGCGVKGNYIGSRYGRVRASVGRTRTGVNAFLPPGATISGTVTSSQADGAPVSGICVNLAGPSATTSATTGKSGRYSIDRLTSGSYYVYFTGGCGNSGSYAPQFFDDQIAAAGATPIRLAAGGAASANASLQPGGTLAGRVTSATAKPLGNVCIESVSQLQDDTATDLTVGAVVSEVESYSFLSTNSAGKYSDPNLAPGLYAVSFSPCNSNNSLGAAWFTGGGRAPRWISVNAGVVTDASVVLPRAGAISGRVTTASGHPVSGICALASPPDEPELASLSIGISGAAITGKTGKYRLKGLAPGTYTITFASCLTPHRYAPAWYKDRQAGQLPTSVTVRPGRTTVGIDGVLSAGKSVSGVIRSGITRRPVAGTCVLAVPGKYSLLSGAIDPFDLQVAVTGKSGRFTLHSLASGSYVLIAGPCVSGSLAFIAGSLKVPAGRLPAKAVTLVLPRAGVISGTVTAPAADGGGGAACVIADPISARDVGPEVAADSGGRYRLTNLAPGRYRIEFTSDCSNGTSELAPTTVSSVTVAGGHTTTVNAALSAVGSITGTVTAGGKPVAGECVAAFTSPTASQPVATAITGADGSYQIGFLSAGSYRVEFATGCGAKGYATQWWSGTATGAPTAVRGIPVSVTSATATSEVNAALAK
jgi:carboxypeptidase family protein